MIQRGGCSRAQWYLPPSRFSTQEATQIHKQPSTPWNIVRSQVWSKWEKKRQHKKQHWSVWGKHKVFQKGRDGSHQSRSHPCAYWEGWWPLQLNFCALWFSHSLWVPLQANTLRKLAANLTHDPNQQTREVEIVWHQLQYIAQAWAAARVAAVVERQPGPDIQDHLRSWPGTHTNSKPTAPKISALRNNDTKLALWIIDNVLHSTRSVALRPRSEWFL